MIERGIRQRLLNFYQAKYGEVNQLFPTTIRSPAFIKEMMRRHPFMKSQDDVVAELEIERDEIHSACLILESAKTVVFAHRQAAALQSSGRHYSDELDFRLPFSDVLLQFDIPLKVVDELGQVDELIALFLHQETLTEEALSLSKHELERRQQAWGSQMRVIDSVSEGQLGNTVIAVFSDLNIRKISWMSTDKEKILQNSSNQELAEFWRKIRNLAVACIGYINCENIYLHRENEVPAAVNRKRAKQGKKVLEPYYVCRIRGVQYDSSGEPTGEGTHHGFRYDVRGHFRRLADGRTTWVRPHQRGLQHELYIPKTYMVDTKGLPI